MRANCRRAPPPSIQSLLELLQVAAQVEAILCGKDKGQALSTLHDLAHRYYGLSPAQIEAYLVELEPEIREAGELLSIHLDTGSTHEELVDEARAQLVQLSLGTALDLQQEKHRNEELECRNRELSVRARTDALTGLPNRAAFDEFLDQQVWQRLRGGVPQALGLILLDIDRFKLCNDTHGHLAGDVVLRAIGEVLRRLKRRGDLAARYGGEEFALVVPHATVAGLRAMSERLRQGIEHERIDIGRQKLQVTASFGAACLAVLRSFDDRAALIALADQHLYSAKKKGRNRCEVYPDTRLPEDGGPAPGA